MTTPQATSAPEWVLIDMRNHITDVREGKRVVISTELLEGEFGSLRSAQQWFMSEGAVLALSEVPSERGHGMLLLSLIPEASW